MSYDRRSGPKKMSGKLYERLRAARKAILPIGSLPVFPRGTGRESTESNEGSEQSRPASIASHGYESNHEELPTFHMRPVAELGFAVASRRIFPGIGYISMAQAFNT